MIEAVHAVLKAIVEKIESLTQLKAHLEKHFFPGSPVFEAAPEAAASVLSLSHEVVRAPAAAPVPASNGVGRPKEKKKVRRKGNNPKSTERLTVLSTLAEPIYAELFADAAGIDKKLAGIALCGYAKNGWLKRTGPGYYQRTAKFLTGSGSAAGRNGKHQKPEKPQRAPKSTSRELVDQMCANLPPPFGVAAVVARTGITPAKARAAIGRWKYNGWISPVEYGTYQHTDKFPGFDAKVAAVTAPRATTPAPAPVAAPLAPLKQPTPPKPPQAEINGTDLPPGSLERRVFIQAQDPKMPVEFTAAALAVALGLSVDAIAIALVKLKRKGYVSDETDPEDNQQIFKLTGKR